MIDEVEEVSETVAEFSEEADALICSIKKVDQGMNGNQERRSLVPRQEDWMLDDPLSPAKENKASSSLPRSYKDACINYDRMMEEEEEENDGWWFNDGWKSHITVDNTGRIPNIVLSDELKNKMAKRWNRSLIVSVLGI